MALIPTDEELAWIRDEIGDAVPPTDDDLADSFDELGGVKVLVALRILKRRRAGLVGGGGVTGFTLTGVLSVQQRSDVAALDRQIARLELLAEGLGEDVGAPAPRSTRLLRRTER
jgi:hypothetical protein